MVSRICRIGLQLNERELMSNLAKQTFIHRAASVKRAQSRPMPMQQSMMLWQSEICRSPKSRDSRLRCSKQNFFSIAPKIARHSLSDRSHSHFSGVGPVRAHIVVVLIFRCMHLHQENCCSRADLLAALQRENLPFGQTAHEWRRSQSFRLSGSHRAFYHQVGLATSLASKKSKVARDQF